MRLALTLVSALLLGSPTATAQQTPFEETVDVNLVLIDAVVVDSDGNQILGLGPDDFIVTENGSRQEIETVEYFSNRRSLDDPALDQSLKLNRDQTQRLFVLFFDKADGATSSGEGRNQLLRAVRDAKHFVKNEIADGDLVAVAGFDARLEIYSDFTNDRETLSKALDQAYRFGSGITTASEREVSLLSNLDKKEMVNKTGRIYDALRLVGDALTPMPGRKVMMMFSPGFGSGPSGHEDDIWFDPMIESLNQSNTSVYILNMDPSNSSSILDNTTGRLADETGGNLYRHTVTYRKPLSRIENLNNGYYLLSYKPKHAPGTHGYQRVDVKLKNSEFKVTARDGYKY